MNHKKEEWDTMKFGGVLLLLLFLVVCVPNLNAQIVNIEKTFPLETSKDKGTQDDLIIYLTGDGGWNNFNRSFIQEFENQHYGIVSLNSRKYFWNEKNPKVLAHDLTQISEYYLKKWDKKSLIIVGYSFGADVASFLPTYLPEALRNKIKRIVILSPSASTDFVVKISDLFGDNDTDKRKFKVQQEIENSSLPIICIFGKEENLILRKSLKKNNRLQIFEIPGDHDFNNNYAELVKIAIS
jgi:type IV secretory pathway VirJ component